MSKLPMPHCHHRNRTTQHTTPDHHNDIDRDLRATRRGARVLEHVERDERDEGRDRARDPGFCASASASARAARERGRAGAARAVRGCGKQPRWRCENEAASAAAAAAPVVRGVGSSRDGGARTMAASMISVRERGRIDAARRPSGHDGEARSTTKQLTVHDRKLDAAIGISAKPNVVEERRVGLAAASVRAVENEHRHCEWARYAAKGVSSGREHGWLHKRFHAYTPSPL